MSQVEESPRTAERRSGIDDDERRELELLRQEVARLRAAPPRQRHRLRWASLAAGVLLVLGCVGVPASVLAVWTHTQVTDTDRFVETVSPVIEDPLVQSALASRITSEVLAYVDVQQIANEAVDALAAQGLQPQLADRLRGLTGPLADGVAGLVRDRVGQLVASPQFVAAWNNAVQVTHDQANAVLSGEAAAVAIKDGRVVLDLGPFVEAAKQRLVESGFGAAARIPEVHPTVDLAAASTLVRAQTAYRTLDSVATWLPWTTLLLLVAGVYLARNRRRALLGVGLAVVAGMVVLAAGLMVGRAVLVGSVPENGAAAAAAGYDLMVRFLRVAIRTLAVLGLVVALGAYLAGPSPGAATVRAGARRAVTALRRGRLAEALGAGPVGPWVHSHVQVLRMAALGLAVLVFVLLDRPTGLDVLLVALGLVVVLVVVEFLDHAPKPPSPGDPGGPGQHPVSTADGVGGGRGDRVGSRT